MLFRKKSEEKTVIDDTVKDIHTKKDRPSFDEKEILSTIRHTVYFHCPKNSDNGEHKGDEPERKREDGQDDVEHVCLLAYTINIGTATANVNRKSECNRTFLHLPALGSRSRDYQTFRSMFRR